MLNGMHHYCLVSYQRPLYILVSMKVLVFKSQRIYIRWHLLTWVGNTVDLWTPISRVLENIYIFQVIISYHLNCLNSLCIFLGSHYLCFRMPSIIRQLYTICHIFQKRIRLFFVFPKRVILKRENSTYLLGNHVRVPHLFGCKLYTKYSITPYYFPVPPTSDINRHSVLKPWHISTFREHTRIICPTF